MVLCSKQWRNASRLEEVQASPYCVDDFNVFGMNNLNIMYEVDCMTLSG